MPWVCLQFVIVLTYCLSIQNQKHQCPGVKYSTEIVYVYRSIGALKFYKMANLISSDFILPCICYIVMNSSSLQNANRVPTLILICR